MTGRRPDGAAVTGGTPALAPGHAHGPAPARLATLLGCVFLAALPIPGLIPLPGGATIALLTMLASTPIWFAAARARRTPFDPVAMRAIPVILACAGFLILWSLLSAIGVDKPLRAGRYLASLIAGFAVYFLVRATVTRPRIVLFVDVVALSLAATAALSLLAYEVAALRPIIFGDTDRAAGLFKNPNQFGMAISTTAPAVLALILAERRRRLLRIACLVLLFLGLVASGSKTNLLLVWATTLAVLCGHSLIAHSGPRRVGMIALYLVGGMGLAALGALALSYLNPRALRIMTEFLAGGGEVDSLMTRSFLWTYSVEQFLADPVFGQGAGQSIDIFYREADVAHSHNVLLDYMRSLGAPGVTAVALMIGCVVVTCVMTAATALRPQRGAPPARLLCLGLSLSALSYVAANMSSDSFGPSTSPFFWLFAYLAFAARSLLDPLADRRPRRRPGPLPDQGPSIGLPALVSQADLDLEHRRPAASAAQGRLKALSLLLAAAMTAAIGAVMARG